ncbi:iron complex transport system ATP-binding protein [Deinococcus metalli]|uniref:Iron complex transport system ATP-binding protein n=1 Tax=Deinococcus metalli TaxID=1141878 RepID=A0A7W8KAG0_9DEIO|nr:ABC transporter ATP-binding protein [Deinococcus metalli]MBB5374665.1 iron complex transport system ATP-binding protein [Deinococcus metalli]GHF34611.1 iron-dicitrate ABC transporter ATP-binding protein [Deinococcus metalli]
MTDPHPTSPAPLATTGLKLGYGQSVVIPDLDLRVSGGKVTSIIGPNGCGKSTLLRALARLLPTSGGHIELYGQALHALPSREVARRLAILPQGPTAPEGLSVEDLVWFGRHPHQGRFPVRREEDREAVHWALDQTGMRVFAGRPLEALSGGQRQRAWIAMSLAQQTDILLLDEPTTYLDLSHQLEVLQLAQRLNQEQGKTVVMVLHDLNQAVRYSDEIIAMQGGQVYAQGPAEGILTHDLLRDVFHLRGHILPDPDTGKPHVIPYALTR